MLLPDKPWFTLAEAAEISGFTERSIREGCQRGEIPHRHFGRQRVMTREHLLAFLAAAEVRPQGKQRAVSPEQAAEVARIDQHRERTLGRLRRKAGAA